ncbi:MAG: sulfatase-like hydrolase/transferase, partial [Verrucomicrobiota bacterium]|nr:sulfatase-like hydrolase/transferase [Verrucomicrobiota bacterium]
MLLSFPPLIAKPPNILLIMADDVGIEGFGCYGGSSYSTPYIDKLAKDGMRFTHAYSQP